MTTYTATYSPDDNKLRLYATARLDATTYERAKACGFRRAPKQVLFFTTWSPSAEDFLIELAGEIEDEDKSLTERAEERAERFEEYGEHRAQDGERAHAAVSAIADNIPLGQPILVGHHSERHARKDAQRIENGMRKAIKAFETSKYWQARAAGAIASAKYKERSDVRHRRIKTIEADKRRQERMKAGAEKSIAAWNAEPFTMERAVSLANYSHLSRRFPLADYPRDPPASQYEGDMGLWSALTQGVISAEQARAIATSAYPRTIAWCDRWINHYAHRLEYERAMLQEAGGLPAEQFDIQVGGRIRFRGDWGTVLKVIKRGGEVLSVKTNARGWGTVGIEEIREYQAPDAETAAKVAAAMKLPPLCNYPGDGFTHLTRAELDARPERRWSDFPKVSIIKATDTTGAHRVPMCRGATQWSTVPVYVTDEKRKDPPAKDRTPGPVIEAPRRAWDPVLEAEARADIKHPDERAEKLSQLKTAARAGVQVVSAPQLFPTPADLARRMVAKAEIPPGARVLEPSAGTGRILEAIEAAHPELRDIHVIEIDWRLCVALASDRRVVLCVNFLDYLNTNDFDRILMNPPFVNGADIKHIMHALTMLRPGGRLVALCANGPRQREALQGLATTWEDLPDGTFAEEGTGVHAALLVIDRAPAPEAEPLSTLSPGEPSPAQGLDIEAKHRAEVEAPHFSLQAQAGAIPAVCGGQSDMFGAAGLDRLPPPKFRNTKGGLFS